MISPSIRPLLRRVSLYGSFFLLLAILRLNASASAETSPVTDATQPTFDSSSAWSSSSEISANDAAAAELSEAVSPEGARSLPSAPTPSSSAAGQENRGGGGWRHSIASKYALELGGGASAPINTSYITWGGQFTVGAGINFSDRFALLAEYGFSDNKLPGYLIAETGANGGHSHIWSLTLDPVVSLFPKSSNDVYITGGGGFYRKVTSFTDPQQAEYCDYYYCGIVTVNSVVGHYSSNQGGINIGAGYQHRMGGMYHDSKMKFFVEARYEDVFTPAVTTQPNGLGTSTVGNGTRLIPVSAGIRW
jgi:hypothetical protein